MPKEITYQNEDVVFKILSETYKEKSFRAYGLDLPRIKAVLPTNLPNVSADEKRMDNLFLLANLMVVSDKFIDREFSDKIGRWLKMTKIARSIAEEAIEERDKEIVLRMLIKGVETDKISDYTGLTFEEVEIIKKESVAKLNA